MKRPTPETYDAITTNTVPELDGSLRWAKPGGLGDPANDPAVLAAVRDALLGNGLDEIGFEVDRGVVILRGATRDAAQRDMIAHLVEGLDGVIRVDNHLHVES